MRSRSILRRMKTIQVVLDEATLRAADREARTARLDRSQFVRAALRHYLESRATRAAEARHRAGYRKHPADDDLAAWEAVQAWPEP